jgi:hypothetical protein
MKNTAVINNLTKNITKVPLLLTSISTGDDKAGLLSAYS